MNTIPDMADGVRGTNRYSRGVSLAFFLPAKMTLSGYPLLLKWSKVSLAASSKSASVEQMRLMRRNWLSGILLFLVYRVVGVIVKVQMSVGCFGEEFGEETCARFVDPSV